MQVLVDGVCTELGVAGRPTVQAEGENAVRVTVDAATAGPDAQALCERLRQVLEPLPVKVQVALSPPAH